jgi:hypothetical protein
MHHEMSSEHSETCCCSDHGFLEHLTDDQKKKIMNNANGHENPLDGAENKAYGRCN